MSRHCSPPCSANLGRRFCAAALYMLALIAGSASAQTVQLAAQTNLGTSRFTYTMNNLTNNDDSVTTTAPGTATPSTLVSTVTNPALPVTVTQATNPQYTLTSASCTDTSTGTTGIGALAGNTLTIAASNFSPTATLVCTFQNTQVAPDLAITKSPNVSTVPSGGTVTYSLVASNIGAVEVQNAVLTDVPGTGLSCTTPATCLPTNGATCPSSLPPGDLFGAGVTIPSLPGGSSVVVTVSCTVTASGQ